MKGRQRAVLVDKLPDLATVAAGALVFGQAISSETFSRGLMLIGTGIWVTLMLVAVFLSGVEDQP
ncbi:MAG: hypothetical protein HY657_05360 [Acidobacteria bacterium]|nr:hypothetical protein [Acidobacteriota bacterium]